MRSCTFRFQKKCGGTSCLAEELLASQEGLCCVELVSWLVTAIFMLQCAIGLYYVPPVLFRNVCYVLHLA